MTTYLLHGGGTSKDLPENDRFFAQFTELVNRNEVKILLCYWSRNRDEWPKLTDRDTTKIKKQCYKTDIVSCCRGSSRSIFKN